MRTAVPADLPAILELLRDNDLPDAGVADHVEHFILEFNDLKNWKLPTKHPF